MGADFLLVCAPLPIFDNRRYVQEFESIKDEVRERILEDESIQIEIADSHGVEMVSELDFDWLEEAMEKMSDYFNVVTSSPRDTTLITLQCQVGHPTRWHIATGGMSWGDYPTDSYEAVMFISSTEIFDRPFRYPENIY